MSKPGQLETSSTVSELTWEPATYEDISRHFQVSNAQTVLSLFPFRGDEVVLDIGSGDGLVTAIHLVPCVTRGRVVGLDLSNEMLSHAQEKYSLSAFPNLTFVQGDACDLDAALSPGRAPLPEFNLVFSNATLHWLIKDQKQNDSRHLAALQGMNRHLVPGGKILLAFIGEGALADLVAASLEVASLEQWAPYFEGFRFPDQYSATKYADLVGQSGFQNIRVDIFDRVMNLSSATELARWYRVSMRSFMARLDTSKQMDFATQAVQRYVGTDDPSRPTSVVYRDLVARATKGL
jgi:trans-aconitate 2-methyltransferase